MSNNCTALDGERKQTCGSIFSVLYHVKYSLLVGRKHKLIRMTLILSAITIIQRCCLPGNGKSKLKFLMNE
jgi:hypothetical protein